MRLSRGVMPWLWSKCLDVSSWGFDSSRNAVPEKVGVITEGACRFAIGAVVGPYAFEECAKQPAFPAPRQSDVRCRLSVVPPFRNSFQVIFLWWENVCGCRPLKAKGCAQEQTANGLTWCFFQGLSRRMPVCIVDSSSPLLLADSAILGMNLASGFCWVGLLFCCFGGLCFSVSACWLVRFSIFY